MRQPFLQYDIELLAAVSNPYERARAIDGLTAERIQMASSERLDAAQLPEPGLGFLVLSGILVREMRMRDRTSAEIIGPEDLVPDSLFAGSAILSVEQSWRALTPCRIVRLDRTFAAQVRAWPGVATALIDRARRPGERAAIDRVIAGLPTVEARLLSSLWHWAQWWAVVSHDGVRLTIPLSHERLSQLVGARRPTVTTAVGRLREAGYLRQDPDGCWRLFTPGVAEAGATAEIPGLADLLALRLPARRVRTDRPSDYPVLPPGLRDRLLEQRELLRTGNVQRRRHLSRLREQTERLRAITGAEERAQAADGSAEERAALADGSALVADARDEESAVQSASGPPTGTEDQRS